MFKNHPVASYLKYSVLAAFLYAIAMLFFIKDASFRDTWILYLGNILFAAGITFFVFSKFKQSPNETTWYVVGAAHITTIMGMLVSCLLLVLLIFIFIPSAFSSHPSTSAMLANSPGQITGKTDGFVMIAFMDAVLGNIFAGFFVSLLFPFSLAKNK